LHKNPKLRWHAIADVRIEIEAAIDDPEGRTGGQASAALARAPLWRRAVPVLVAIVVTALVAGFAAWHLKPSRPDAVVRFPITLGEGQRFTGLRFGTQVAISPDGTQIVYEANHQLYHRLLAESEANSIPGTQTTRPVLSPVFSPDGRFVAYIE